jgi:DNA-directed RNA polymerase subunit RPC12/RpoP
MGFFENLGRKVGEFTHEAKEAAADSASYACTDCGEEFYTAQEHCPECGSEAVVERQTASGDDSDGSETLDGTAPDEADPGDDASEPKTEGAASETPVDEAVSEDASDADTDDTTSRE